MLTYSTSTSKTHIMSEKSVGVGGGGRKQEDKIGQCLSCHSVLVHDMPDIADPGLLTRHCVFTLSVLMLCKY